MDSSPVSCPLDIFEIYRRFSEIRSSQGLCNIYKPYEESQGTNHSKEALTQLLSLVEDKFQARNSLFDELFKLMSRLDLMVDFSEFRRFYDFVFFMCRENGQKSITVGRAITAWKRVLVGRFRLLNHWCDFIEKNQRHNVTEDTWRQVLTFSRRVHENLQGYDSQGAWSVVIDEFVEHMYSILGPRKNTTLSCNCGDTESESCLHEDPLSDERQSLSALPACHEGLRSVSGLKRKTSEDNEQEDDGEVSESECSCSSPYYMKRIRSGDSPRCSAKTHCAIERSLSQGFASLLSTGDKP